MKSLDLQRRVKKLGDADRKLNMAYDSDANAAYITLPIGEDIENNFKVETYQLTPDLYIDLYKGKIVGVEILNARDHINLCVKE